MAKNNTKVTETKKSNKEEKVMTTKKTVNTKKEVKKVDKKEVNKAVKEVKEPKVKVEKKKSVSVPQMTNSELKELFNKNGCKTRTNASDKSKVVYNTFGTQSRVLQQNRSYQLLLTNGHELKKGIVVEAENDDVARFTKWYDGLNDEQKSYINGFDTITATKLATSEMPRERTVKIINYDLLVDFIKYMATFTENKIAEQSCVVHNILFTGIERAERFALFLFQKLSNEKYPAIRHLARFV